MDESEHPSSAYSPEDTAEQPQDGGAVPVDVPGAQGTPAIPEASEPFPAWIPAAPPGAPLSSGEGAWSFGKPAAGSGLPRGRKPLALLLVVVLVAAAGAYALLSRRSSSGGTAFALTLSRDKTYSYDIRIGMNGTISMQGEQVPFRMNMDQVIGWRVESTDTDGTATVAVTVETRAAQFNEQPAPAIPTQTSRIRVAKDGRILSADFGLSGLGTNRPGDLGSLVPGGDQFMPLLPDHPVKVGDTWTKTFDQELPFGMGRFRYDVESSLLRYGEIDGKRMAVLFSTLRLPLNMTIDLKKLLAASGGLGAQSLPGGGNPKMRFGGSMTMQQTAWFDQAHGELYMTNGIARFDMSIEFKDFPAQANPPAGAMNFKGTMELQVQRLLSAPKPSSKELKALKVVKQDKEAQRDLLKALAAAKTSFVDWDSYAKVSPGTLERIEPSLTFDTSLKARLGQISLRQVTPNVVLLVTRSASGHVFCIGGDQSDTGHDHYGRQNARSLSRCTGGW
jgi:hypothetical protein